MNTAYEAINFNKEIPVNLLLHSAGFVQNHWHDALEILFVLEGNINVVSLGTSITLGIEDIFIVCPNQIHSITSSDKNVVLLLQISKEFIEKHSGQNFTLRQAADEKHKTQLKKLLAEIIWVNNKKSSFYSIKQRSLLFSILFTLAREFMIFGSKSEVEKHKHNERIEGLISFIKENYHENISLQVLSEKYHLTPSYISRFFTNNIGTSFKNYLTNLRLEHAVNELISTDKNILDISLESGFPNAKSLSSEFRKVYSGTINEYRKKYKQNKKIVLDIKRPNTNYTELKNHDYFSTLFKYLKLKENFSENSQIVSKIEEHSISFLNNPKTLISPYWKKIMSVSRAKDLLREDLRSHLRTIQSEIAFSQIRFHGIFDDAMMVYLEDEDGNITLNFDYIDNILDFLLSINLKPFIEIGFMPKILAKNKTPYFHSPSYPSPPTDFKKWLFLLNGFINHLFHRYTKKEVISWQFEFWNEPELLNVFWKGTDKEFLDFYLASYNEIKGISNRIKIGGPSISQINGMESWLSNYFEFCKTNRCMPDFFAFHFYPHDESVELLAKELLSGKHLPRISPNENLLKEYMGKVLLFIEKYGYTQEDIYITEWNSSAFHRELSHDTAYKACYIAKNIAQNFNQVGSLSYWTMSDIIEELSVPKETFHGGIGVITKEGIKKAAYYSFYLLNKLGNRLLYTSENFIVTCSNNEIQILMFNYCHFDELYCNNDRSMINYLERYDVYSKDESIEISLLLKDLPSFTGKMCEYTISKSFGSSYDTWLKMGHPESLEKEEIEILKSVKPAYKTSTVNINSSIRISRTLSPHDVKLITIKALDNFELLTDNNC